jgi:hypothetical protein
VWMMAWHFFFCSSFIVQMWVVPTKMFNSKNEPILFALRHRPYGVQSSWPFRSLQCWAALKSCVSASRGRRNYANV